MARKGKKIDPVFLNIDGEASCCLGRIYQERDLPDDLLNGVKVLDRAAHIGSMIDGHQRGTFSKEPL